MVPEGDGGRVRQPLGPHPVPLPQRHPRITGHSLGAALATLATYRFGRAHGCYTIGSPLVGDRRFAEAFPIRAYRFVNNNDIVARIPPWGPRHASPPLRYEHVGILRYLDRHGVCTPDGAQPGQLAEVLLGAFERHAESVLQALRRKEWTIPFDHLADHAPRYYAIHIWNNYVASASAQRDAGH